MIAFRKKQDENNLHTLRELSALQHNKYCFDCNQRGPTYVNITIGSFVCTKCSGILRGLTPPHRVKSITMSTFSPEEIDLLRGRGNDYCRKVWLGLFEGTPPNDTRDEQSIRDFMIEKYERKRYYLDASQIQHNGYAKPSLQEHKKSTTNGTASNKNARLNGHVTTTTSTKRPEVAKTSEFVADFESADIFSATNGNNNNSSNGVTQQGFANFDNNPVFNNANSSMPPTSNVLNNINNQQILSKTPPPAEDKYAALKDLDNALKHNQNQQSTLDWSSSSSNGSLYSSSTPTGSMYSSPSPQNSIFGSPSQAQFINAFPAQESTMVANPFSNGLAWNANGLNTSAQQFANPFRANEAPFRANEAPFRANEAPFRANEAPFQRNETPKMNGFTQNFQPVFPANGTVWPPNPFKMAPAAATSTNPFL